MVNFEETACVVVISQSRNKLLSKLIKDMHPVSTYVGFWVDCNSDQAE